jgi:hypothetical protein
LAAAALLSACGSGATPNAAAPLGPERVAQPATIAARVTHPVALQPDRSPSWMDPAAAKGSLLYISDMVRGRVYAYAYPSGKRAGSLTGFYQPQGVCADGNGNVWVVNTGTAQVIEYAHGGTAPIATLDDPNQNPVGCAIDPKNGNLAVSNLSDIRGGPGSISLYKKAQGTPKLYRSKAFQNLYFLGYDSAGNLFVDGIAVHKGYFALGEMAHGSKTIATVRLSGPTIAFPGGVQSDGTNMAIGDQVGAVVYQISGTTVESSTPLEKACIVGQFVISGGKIVAPNLCTSGNALFYNYPAGGSPTKTLKNLAFPIAATISSAPQER